MSYAWPPSSYSVDPNPYCINQNIDIQPKAVGEEVERYVTFIADNTVDHDCCWKFCLHDSGYVVG